jgi:hypothetical protein
VFTVARRMHGSKVAAGWAKAGTIFRQYPHQSTQKSTRTGKIAPEVFFKIGSGERDGLGLKLYEQSGQGHKITLQAWSRRPFIHFSRSRLRLQSTSGKAPCQGTV